MQEIYLNNKKIDFSEPITMGILNVTPDSFYDGGKYQDDKTILSRCRQIIDEGAQIIDIGAYSTRPGALFVDENEEYRRLSAVMDIVKNHFPEAMISIDSFRSAVVEKIHKKYGPVIVNDISGGTMDCNMFDFVAETQLPYIMMHIQGTPQTMQINPHYDNLSKEVMDFFEERITILNKKNFFNIILDPGFGFGKTIEHNYELLNHLRELTRFGYPILSALSRKSMIYRLLSTDAEHAQNGTTALNMVSLLNGANMLRVHDVREAVEVVKIYQSLRNNP